MRGAGTYRELLQGEYGGRGKDKSLTPSSPTEPSIHPDPGRAMTPGGSGPHALRKKERKKGEREKNKEREREKDRERERVREKKEEKTREGLTRVGLCMYLLGHRSKDKRRKFAPGCCLVVECEPSFGLCFDFSPQSQSKSVFGAAFIPVLNPSSSYIHLKKNLRVLITKKGYP